MPDRLTVTGDFIQSATGRLGMELGASDAASDLITVGGNAQLAGSLKVFNVGLTQDRVATVLTAGGTVTGSLDVTPSPIFTYSTWIDGNALRLQATSADFVDPLSGSSQTSQAAAAQSGQASRAARENAQYLQHLWDADAAGKLGPVLGALDQAAETGTGSYDSALQDLSLGVAAAPAARRQSDMQDFADSLMSCPQIGDGTVRLGEGKCIWARFGGLHANQDGSNGTSGFDQNALIYQLGAEGPIAPDWSLGLSLAYQHDWYDSHDNRSSSHGDSAFGGISLKHAIGPWRLAGAVAGSYGWYHTERDIQAAGINGTAKSDPDIQSVGFRTRAGYLIGAQPAYIEPMLDLDAIYTRQPSYDKSGAGAANLDVRSSDQWGLIATPGIEVGAVKKLSGSIALRAYARAGVSFSNQSNWTSTSTFSAAGGGVPGVGSDVPMDETTARLTAGIQLFANEHYDVRLEYNGAFSSHVTSNGGSLRLSWFF